jgi:steroid 5-alpha reductase family enzyme
MTFQGPGAVLTVAAICVAVLILALWAASLALHDASIIDPAWSVMFVVVAVVGVAVGDGDPARRWVLLLLTGAWGLRLAMHLARRKLAEPGEDRRYAQMRERRGDRGFAVYSLWAIYAVQGLLVLIVSLPLQAGAESPTRLSVAVVPGVMVFALGLFFELVGDEQLRRFKADPANRGRVMDRGLWRYTRHPNYFGDASVWWGLWLLVLPAGGTWWTFVGPLVMTVLLVRVSGAALLERDIGRRRPDYQSYIERTSGFIPKPPRRSPRP